MQVRKCLHQMHSAFLSQSVQFLRFLCSRNQRFLTQDMFSVLKGFLNPFIVKGIWKRDIYGFHIRIFQKRIVISVSPFKTKFFLKLLCLFDASSCYGIEIAVFSQHHTRNGLSLCDSGSPDHTPVYFLHISFLLTFFEKQHCYQTSTVPELSLLRMLCKAAAQFLKYTRQSVFARYHQSSISCGARTGT